MHEEELARVFKALSSQARLKILRLIRDHPLCVGAITRRLGISQSAVSQHLRVLREVGLVQREPYGSIVHYALHKKRLEAFKRSVRRTMGEEFVLLKG